MKNILKNYYSSLNEHKRLIENFINIKKFQNILKISKIIAKCLKYGGTVFWCGNGGSASDSQHLSAELIGRLKKNRKPLKSISLSSNISVLTCISNDFGYKKIFSRQLEALGSKKDVLICISTSGNSKNIIEILKIAKKKKIMTISFLGNNGGKSLKLSKNHLLVDSKDTARIQEMHIFLGQIICDNVEKILKL